VGNKSIPPLCLGTAGHVDHGKTWLVRALTGKDTDRLPEERRRGISIDLGYARLDLPDGRCLSVVDVPGHERFVRTMVAGATGIDLFLLVIDAAEGARPQTHEHLAIIRLLEIDTGVVAVTKADAVDAQTLDLALEEARELVPGAPIVAASAKTGAGLTELRSALTHAAATLQPCARREPEVATRLFVDRAFTLQGIGTVATGTLRSGSIGAGDELRVDPAGLDVRVRSVQVHDRPVERAHAGQRVAVSLPGVDREALRRGDALVEPGTFPTSYRLDVVLEELAPIEHGLRVRVHHGTAEIPARVVRAGGRFAQLRLACRAVAARGDRVVLRTQTTLGGGRVLDPAPPRHADATRFERLERGDVAATIHEPVRIASLRHLLDSELEGVERVGEWAFSRAWLEELRKHDSERLTGAAWERDLAPLLGARQPTTTPPHVARADEAAKIEEALASAGPAGAKVEDRELAAHLETEGKLVRLGRGFAIATTAYEEARRILVAEGAREGSITLARYRDLLGISRRRAQLLLERFDVDGLTRRDGDIRILRRRFRTNTPLDRSFETEHGQSPRS
jgi:selenocysteine-specific elongation factor